MHFHTLLSVGGKKSFSWETYLFFHFNVRKPIISLVVFAFIMKKGQDGTRSSLLVAYRVNPRPLIKVVIS